MPVRSVRSSEELLQGCDIAHNVTAHELARLLLAGPDLTVLVPDDEDAQETVDAAFVGIGRITNDSSFVYLGGYFAADEKVSPTYKRDPKGGW